MIQAPGRSVPALLSFLKPQLDDEKFSLLHEYQLAVVAALNKQETEETMAVLSDPAPLKALVLKKSVNAPLK